MNICIHRLINTTPEIFFWTVSCVCFIFHTFVLCPMEAAVEFPVFLIPPLYICIFTSNFLYFFCSLFQSSSSWVSVSRYCTTMVPCSGLLWKLAGYCRSQWEQLRVNLLMLLLVFFSAW
jgi:hypothetical protein